MSQQEAKPSTTEIIKGIVRFIIPHKRLFIFSALLIPLTAAFQLLQPYIVKLTIDNYISQGQVTGIALFSLFYLAAFFLQSATDLGQAYLLNLGSQRALFDMRDTLFSHTLKLPLRFFDRMPAGAIVTRVNDDVSSINDLFVNGIVSLAKDVVLLIAIVVTLLTLHWKLALVTLSVMPFLIVFVAWFQKWLRQSYNDLRKYVGKLNGYLAENVSGIEVIKLFQREERNHQEYDAINSNYHDAGIRSIRVDAMLFAVVELFSSVVIALVLWYGSTWMMQGHPQNLSSSALTFGTLVAFIEYLNRFFVPLRDFSGKFSIIQSAASAGDRILKLLDEPAEATDQEKSHSPLKQEQTLAIELKNLDLSYNIGTQVLHGIDLDIEAGENLAIVGATGSGKTSLARLLLRFYDFQAGEIILRQGDHEEEIRQVPLLQLRRIIGMVPQDVAIFRGTAAENVIMQPAPLTESMHKRVSEIFDQINLRNHFKPDAQLGERGFNMSAGERQLLALARILYFNPGTVIFDEATSNIDAQTEQQIQQAMELVMQGRTSIVIAHRLSTIQKADRILVMNCGKIVAAGNHQALLLDSPVYQRLVQEYGGPKPLESSVDTSP